MTFATIGQKDFGGGIFRGRRAAGDSVYDAINALINDERELFRRGGSEFMSTSNAGSTLAGLTDLHLPPGRRTLMWTGGSTHYALSAAEAPLTLPSAGGHAAEEFARAATVGGLLVLPASTPGYVLVYGGSRKTANYNVGTVGPTVDAEPSVAIEPSTAPAPWWRRLGR